MGDIRGGISVELVQDLVICSSVDVCMKSAWSIIDQVSCSSAQPFIPEIRPVELREVLQLSDCKRVLGLSGRPLRGVCSEIVDLVEEGSCKVAHVGLILNYCWEGRFKRIEVGSIIIFEMLWDIKVLIPHLVNDRLYRLRNWVYVLSILIDFWTISILSIWFRLVKSWSGHLLSLTCLILKRELWDGLLGLGGSVCKSLGYLFDWLSEFKNTYFSKVKMAAAGNSDLVDIFIENGVYLGSSDGFFAENKVKSDFSWILPFHSFLKKNKSIVFSISCYLINVFMSICISNEWIRTYGTSLKALNELSSWKSEFIVPRKLSDIIRFGLWVWFFEFNEVCVDFRVFGVASIHAKPCTIVVSFVIKWGPVIPADIVGSLSSFESWNWSICVS